MKTTTKTLLTALLLNGVLLNPFAYANETETPDSTETTTEQSPIENPEPTPLDQIVCEVLPVLCR